MDAHHKPSTSIRVLSVLHVVYLGALPTLANFTIVPALDNTLEKLAWGYFGLFCVPLVFAGMKTLNRFPMEPIGAMMHVLFVPVATGLWWWLQEGTLLKYFTILLIFESLAIFISVFLMSFVPMRYYDPTNPKARGIGNYIMVAFTSGIILSGGFIAALGIVMWSWWTSDPFWQHPVTLVLLLIASVEYMYRNFQYHMDKNQGQQASILSIEPLLLLSPIPWAISWALLV